MKENAFRRRYRQLQWHAQPITPQTPCASGYEERYAPSTVSSVSRSSGSRSSRRSCASTITGQNDDAQYEISQTSQVGCDDDRSVSDRDEDTASSAVASSVVASWVDSTTSRYSGYPSITTSTVTAGNSSQYGRADDRRPARRARWGRPVAVGSSPTNVGVEVNVIGPVRR